MPGFESVPNAMCEGRTLRVLHFNDDTDIEKYYECLPRDCNIPPGFEKFVSWVEIPDKRHPDLIMGLRRVGTVQAPSHGMEKLSDADLMTEAGKRGVKYDTKSFRRGDVIAAILAKGKK